MMSTESTELQAAVDRVRQLHTITHVTVFLDSDCFDVACDHDDSCPTATFEACAACVRLAEDAVPYGGAGNIPRSAYWPCLTIRALTPEDLNV